MSTARDFVNMALDIAGIVGVGQTPLAQDSNRAFSLMNMMLNSWSRRRWLVFHLQDVVFRSTGAASYTVGTGGNFVVARPDRIASAFARFTAGGANPVDYPLEEIPSYEDYSRITLKSLSSVPTHFFYDSGNPLGSVYFWPRPSALYEMHIQVKAALDAFTNLTDTVALPPEYDEAITYNLARRLRVAYRRPVDMEVNRLATEALSTLRKANVQIPTLTMPGALRRGGSYNVYSDGGR